MTTKRNAQQILNYDPSLDDVVKGKDFYADLVAWRAETMDGLKEAVTMVNAIWEIREYRTTPATCVCGCALDANGKCPLELDAAALSLVEPAVSDDDTEELTPLWAEMVYDQPALPHEGRPDVEQVWFRGYAATHKAHSSIIEYRNWTGASLRLSTIAVKHILTQMRQS